MSGKENNVYISKMRKNMNEAMLFGYRHTISCAEEIKPMLEKFFRNVIESDFDISRAGVCKHLVDITEIGKFLGQNTRNCEPLSEEDVEYVRKLVDELEALRVEALKLNSKEVFNGFGRKIECISEILCKNMMNMLGANIANRSYRTGMIFESYQDLWEIIHRINTEWEDLCSRGFELKVFYDFWQFLEFDKKSGKKKSEAEKFVIFMSLLDGEMKFIPIYEYRPIAYTVVQSNYGGSVIINTIRDERCGNSYRLRKLGETTYQYEQELEFED